MLVTTELIVLDAVRYSDTAAIVHTYSRDFGPLHLKVSRPSSRRRQGGARAFFSPLSLLEVTMDYRPKREVQTPLEARLEGCPGCVATDPGANAVALFLTELLFRLLRSEEPDKALFSLLRGEILSMDLLSSAELANFHLVLLTKMLPLLGVLPDLNGYREGYLLDFEEGRFYPPAGGHQRERIRVSGLFCRLMKEEAPLSVPLTREERGGLLDLLLGYLGTHFPSVQGLKSPAILPLLFRPL